MTFFAALGLIVLAVFFYELGYQLAAFLDARDRLDYIAKEMSKHVSEIDVVLAAIPARKAVQE